MSPPSPPTTFEFSVHRCRIIRAALKSLIVLHVESSCCLAFVAMPKCNPLSDATTTSL
jgi:hypothetical protein